MSSRFPGRRLSWLRLLVLIVIAGLLGGGAWIGIRQWQDSATASAEGTPWFAGYVDVTATPTYEMETVTGSARENVVLSFIVADPEQGCVPTWGGAYTLDQAAADLDLDRRLARMTTQGRDLVVSFGGLLNDELAVRCESVPELVQAYRTVIERYDITTIDLDIEGDALADPVSSQRRAEAVAQLQDELRAEGRDLAVWMTLPVITTGLTPVGTDAVAQMLEADVDLAGVNVMTMNFGGSLDEDESMAEASIRSLQATHRQLGIIYDAAGIQLGDRTLWRKIGATPMIGQNDVSTEVFTLDDATALNSWAQDTGIGRLSMWSFNRDITCSVNYADLGRVNDSCSGIPQGDAFFAELLAAGFEGGPNQSAGVVTTGEDVEEGNEIVDDPETSPYPIWNEDAAYPAGSKVVWHRSVYEAKWWSEGDVPDDPVLQETDTPWRLIGPVLEGETPIELPTLPAGYYAEWDPTVIYRGGDRIMFEGTAFQARWWTQGDSPESGFADPGNSAWSQLDEREIRSLLGQDPQTTETTD